MEDTLATLVERQVTTTKIAPRKMKNANIVEPSVMWNSPVLTRKTKLHDSREKGCVQGGKQLSLVKSMRRRVAVVAEICEGSVADDDDAKKNFSSTMAPVTIPVGRKVFSKSLKTSLTRSLCIIWSEVCA